MALKDFAGAAVGAAGMIGGWLGIGEARQDRRQVKQQGKLNDVNAKTSKELADYDQALKLKMWKDTNYGGQLEQAEQAGVSKAAAIGGSGTGTQGASVSGISGTGAADAASTQNARTASINQSMMLASQLNLMKAQKDNIEADTANKQAGAGKATAETNTENEVTEIRGNERTISDRTMKEQETIVDQRAAGAILDNAAKKQGIKVDKARVEEIINNIKQRWESLRLEGKSIEQSKENMEKLTEAMLWGAGINAAGNIVRDVVGIVTKIPNKGNTTERATQSWEGGSRSTTTTRPNQ